MLILHSFERDYTFFDYNNDIIKRSSCMNRLEAQLNILFNIKRNNPKQTIRKHRTLQQTALIIGCLFAVFLCQYDSVYATEASIESGFSGYVSPVSGMVGTTSNFYAFEGQKFTIDDLSGDMEYDDALNQGFLEIVGEISYMFESGLQMYFGVPFDQQNPWRYYMNEGISLGLVQYYRDIGRIDLSVFISNEYVWENPYLTGEERTARQSNKAGLVFDYDHILGSDWNLLYKFKRKEMDETDDVIGSLYPDLQRDGFIHTAEIDYNFLLNKQHIITPGVTLVKADIEGESNAYNGCSVKLDYMWDKESFILNSSISARREIYDKTHPLFDETRKDSVFSTGLGLTLLGNLGFENVFAHCNIRFEKRISNIGFCDADSFTPFITVGYNF